MNKSNNDIDVDGIISGRKTYRDQYGVASLSLCELSNADKDDLIRLRLYSEDELYPDRMKPLDDLKLDLDLGGDLDEASGGQWRALIAEGFDPEKELRHILFNAVHRAVFGLKWHFVRATVQNLQLLEEAVKKFVQTYAK